VWREDHDVVPAVAVHVAGEQPRLAHVECRVPQRDGRTLPGAFGQYRVHGAARWCSDGVHQIIAPVRIEIR